MSRSNTDKNNLAAFMSKSDIATPQEPQLAKAVVSAASARAPMEEQAAKKTGRPSFKKPDIAYERLNIEIPAKTKEMLESARIKIGGPHKGKQQAVIVDEALRAYLKG